MSSELTDEDVLGCFAMITVVIVVSCAAILGMGAVKGCDEKTVAVPTTQPTTRPSADKDRTVVPRKALPPKEIAPNIYYFDSIDYPANLVTFLLDHPNKIIVNQPVFQPAWVGATAGHYTVIFRDIPKDEPKIE